MDVVWCGGRVAGASGDSSGAGVVDQGVVLVGEERLLHAALGAEDDPLVRIRAGRRSELGLGAAERGADQGVVEAGDDAADPDGIDALVDRGGGRKGEEGSTGDAVEERIGAAALGQDPAAEVAVGDDAGPDAGAGGDEDGAEIRTMKT